MSGPNKQALENNAEQAYKQVPTQQEMLNGNQKTPDTKQKASANPAVTKSLDKELDEAAQQGNIGGG